METSRSILIAILSIATAAQAAGEMQAFVQDSRTKPELLMDTRDGVEVAETKFVTWKIGGESKPADDESDAHDYVLAWTPEYWLSKHFFHNVVPGLVRVPCEGKFSDALAFRGPDAELVLAAVNMRDCGYQLSARIGCKYLQALLPARSFNTFVLDDPSDQSSSINGAQTR